MTTFPLPTLGCTITPAGISSPSYADIYASLQASFQSIYGTDAYIDPDSQDGQMLAVFAQAQYDSNQATIAAYSNFSPATAQGTGLSTVVKINGLKRQVPSNSTAPMTLVGQAGSQVQNGLIGDNQNLGTQWALPGLVVIPDSGTITTTAICTKQGAVTAAANTLTKILNPQLGWQTVNNASNATPGAPVETDSQLRQRQSVSTSLPAQSVIGGVYGTIANLPGVSRLKVYENDGSTTDINGLPGHSISVVAAGGAVSDIATAIEQKKTPGTNTYGSTSFTVLDPVGLPIVIRYFVLADVIITVAVGLRALPGYVSSTGMLVSQVVAAVISALSIGEVVYLNRLFSAANLSGDVAVAVSGQTQAALDSLSNTYTVSSIVISRSSNPPDTTVTGGPYSAGTTSITVVSAADLYLGCPIGITLDNATTLNTTVASITSNTIGLSNAVPTSRSILNNANLYMTTDVKTAFNEAAIAAPANVTVTPT